MLDCTPTGKACDGHLTWHSVVAVSAVSALWLVSIHTCRPTPEFGLTGHALHACHIVTLRQMAAQQLAGTSTMPPAVWNV